MDNLRKVSSAANKELFPDGTQRPLKQSARGHNDPLTQLQQLNDNNEVTNNGNVDDNNAADDDDTGDDSADDGDAADDGTDDEDTAYDSVDKASSDSTI